MAELEYVFQSEKLYKGGGTTLSLEQGLANRFKKLISNDVEGFFNVIWGNTALRGSLIPQRPLESISQWEIRAKSEFTTMVNSLNGDFFKFIKVR
jgi:hypothetical protein